jgi:ubiquinol-cytochrome c reductase cytochrome b subunit
MYGLHVMLLPIAITLLVVLHVIQVRLHGVVAPLGATEADLNADSGAVGTRS